MKFKGKNIVVIGGGTISGIGLSLVKKLLVQKVEKISIFDICDAQKAKDDLNISFPHNSVKFHQVDVRGKDQIKDALDKVINMFGQVDILFNCAAIFNEKSVEETLHVNLFGVIYATQLAIENMSLENGGRGGTIVNIASTAGLTPSYIAPVYSASKHGVIGYTRALSDEKFEAIFGVKFIVICPGYTETTILNSMATGVFRNDILEEASSYIDGMKKQSPSECAKCILDAMNVSKNGSVWLVEGGQYTPVKFEKYMP